MAKKTSKKKTVKKKSVKKKATKKRSTSTKRKKKKRKVKRKASSRSPKPFAEFGATFRGGFAHSVLLIPKHYADAPHQETFAQAVLGRSAESQTLEYRVPTKNAASALKKIGMDDMEHVQHTRQPVSTQGVYSRLDSLGMTSAFFDDEKHRDDAKTELDNEYDFVPNFPLAIPARVQLADVPATRGQAPPPQHEWPDASGVAVAHSKGVRGSGVLMGVLDTGVDADHTEFRDRRINFRYVSIFPDSPYWPPRDVRGFDTDGHGTHVCGIIAGQNVGVAPEVGLYCASVIESETTRSSLLRVAHGLDWILRQFSRPDNERLPGVLSMSLGFPSTAPGDIGSAEFNARVGVMRTLLQTLIQANVLPIVAIGNSGSGVFGLPGAFEDVIGVGAVDFAEKIAGFSGSGQYDSGAPKPDICGYGVGVYSSVERDYANNSHYERMNGTSMATPYVAGVAALYRCQQPALTVEEARERVLGSAKKLTGQPKTRVGSGLARFEL